MIRPGIRLDQLRPTPPPSTPLRIPTRRASIVRLLSVPIVTCLVVSAVGLAIVWIVLR